MKENKMLHGRNQVKCKPDSQNQSVSINAKPTAGACYLPYPKALKILARRYNATREDIAGWVLYGPELGGLAAYETVTGLVDPPRFNYGYYTGNAKADYLSLLMLCWFNAEEIARFNPVEKYITGNMLIERWGEQLGIEPRTFIVAKIRESRLLDCHPIFGMTQMFFFEGDLFPPLETGLFALSQIEEIERSDFGNDDTGEVSELVSQTSVAAWRIIDQFRVRSDSQDNETWWRSRMSDAGRYKLSDCRHEKGRPGKKDSSMWFPAGIVAWLIEKGHMSKEKALKLLRQYYPECSDAADMLE